MDEKTYRVFTRCPWRPNPAYPKGWEPFGGAEKKTVASGVSLAEAKRICTEGNEGVPREPGSTWHEFESE